jgi:predicted metal-dependent HD superfamily phosphohydrolase
MDIERLEKRWVELFDLIDLDLSILGANDELYDSYELWIRKEYALIPNFLYSKVRKKVLNSFVKLDIIYQTAYFYEKYEIQARQNINRALQKL